MDSSGLANQTSTIKAMAVKSEHHRALKWISKAIKHPGSLRATLGAKKGESIPAGKLAAAARQGGVTGKRARLAETLRHLHH